MKRLFWKELRERWIWLVLLAASAVGAVLSGSAYAFVGNETPLWLLLTGLIALLMGTGAYSSELSGTADFLLAKPVSWKKLLAVKLLVGLAFIALAMVLAALTYRLICPEQYVRFVDPSHLARKTAGATAVMGLIYLFGFVGSAVVPGTLGGLSICVLLIMSIVVQVATMNVLRILPLSKWSIYLVFVGAALATVVISRFGLTLPTRQRAIRLAAIVGWAIAIGIPMDYLVKYDPFPNQSVPPFQALSPDGKYAVIDNVTFTPQGKQIQGVRLARMSDKKTVEYPRSWALRDRPFFWSGDVLVSAEASGNKGTVWICWMGGRGRGHFRHLNVPCSTNRTEALELTPSPDIKRAILAETGSSGKQLSVIEMKDGKLAYKNIARDTSNYWWQSDTEVGCVGKNGNGQVISVVD